MGQAGADGRRHRLFDQVGGRRAGPAGRSFMARRSTEVMAEGTQISTLGRFILLTPARRKRAGSSVGHLEVGDGPLPHRPHRNDVTRRAADHLPRLVALWPAPPGPGVEGHHRRLVEDDPPPRGVDEGVRRPRSMARSRAIPAIVGAGDAVGHEKQVRVPG